MSESARLAGEQIEVRLLLDENLPRRLKVHVRGLFPLLVHVSDKNLLNVPDSEIWDVASTSGFAIVSKDRDFADRVIKQGPPPSVIHLNVGNCPTRNLVTIIRDAADGINCHVQSGGGLLRLGDELRAIPRL